MLHALPLLLLTFLPCSFKSDVEAAASRLRVELPPVPAYPRDGRIPAELRDRFVFLNEDTGDLIMSYPSGLGFEDHAPGQVTQDTQATDTRVIERMTLAIATCPSFGVVVIHESNDRRGRAYEYRYRVRNRSEARLPIGKWVMRLPDKVSVGSIVSAKGWGVEDWEQSEEQAVLALEAKSASWGDEYREKVQQSMLRKGIRWWAIFSEWLLEPGKEAEPFGFTTDARPGIVRAYIQASPYGLSTRSGLPVPVQHQLWAFGFEENNSLSISTIGPKFSPDADKASIASDFLDGISDLIERGELSRESKFPLEALVRLKAFAQGDAGAVDRGPWLAEPETEFETAILSAIHLSLRDQMNLDRH